jgi:hypothetical protein
MYRYVDYTLASKEPLKDSDPLSLPSAEQVVYWIARTMSHWLAWVSSYSP